jgi:hypothetical protein
MPGPGTCPERTITQGSRKEPGGGSSSAPSVGSPVLGWANPGILKAPIAHRNGWSDELCTKKGELCTRFSGAALFLGFEVIRPFSVGISVQ